MFALLGNIQFDLITYFDGFESKFGADFAEHAVIEGKPRLQWIGDKLDEVNIQLSFHLEFCDPEAELLKLRGAVTSHEAMALVLGNGDYKGWFVVTSVDATSRQTDQAGTLIALDAQMTLREFVGDKKNPQPRPAVRPPSALPPVEGRRVGTSALTAAPATRFGENAVRGNVRETVSLANQATSALRLVSDAVSIARGMGGNPLAMLSRVPNVLDGLARSALPLSGMRQPLADLSLSMPGVGKIASASGAALIAVRDAQTMLTNADPASIANRMNYVGTRLRDASGQMEGASPHLSRLAGAVVTRRV